MVFSPMCRVRSLVDIQTLEQTPVEQAIQTKTTYEIFVNSAKTFGDKTALRFLKDGTPGSENIAWSYKELLNRMHQTANLLFELGMGPTDTVSILLPGCLEYHLALWGGGAAGIVNPLNPLLSEEKLAELMNAAKTKILIAYGVDGDTGFWQKAMNVRQHVPTLEAILRVSPPDETIEERPVLLDGMHHFQDRIATQEADRLVSGRDIKGDDIAAYFHTGGTTGSPKLAKHTHKNQVFTAWACVQLQGISDIDITINGYPLFHVAGVLPGSLTALSAGVETIIPTAQMFRNKDIVKNYWKLVDHHKATSISAVPTVLAALAGVALDGADISSVRYCRTGAAPLPPELAQRFKKLFNMHVHESLGMTETTGITSITPPRVTGPVGCVGFPLPYSEFRIGEIGADGELTGQEMPQGETGMLLIKSPNVFPGYLDEEETKKVFTEDGFLISGDVGWMDEFGRLNLTGRVKDLIIRSGHNIDPKAIEDELGHHESVDLCAVVAQPDAYAGELPVAFVTVKAGAQTTEAELLAFICERVEEAPAKPKSVTIIKTMPQTNVGKIFKPELRRLASEMAFWKQIQTVPGKIGGIKITGILDAKGKTVVEVVLDKETDKSVREALIKHLSQIPIEISIK